VIPARASAAFVAAMEAVLELYLLPPDPARPLVCFDEAGKELQADVRDPLPPAVGQVAAIDPEYARHGSASLLLACAPHLGWRQVTVTAQRTRREFAHAMRDLVDVQFPDAETIRVVLDNLNTHTLASLYHAFPAPEARRLARKLELVYTPKHGSWLNIAELELSALARQCLDRRLPDRDTLDAEVAAWVAARNAAAVRVDWRFGPEDARRTMPSVYPTPIEPGPDGAK
jgi:hypothetical protein